MQGEMRRMGQVLGSKPTAKTFTRDEAKQLVARLLAHSRGK